MFLIKKSEIKSFLLEIGVREFMDYWRSNWSGESVTPKMHMLEEHMVQFLQKWKLGCGFYGEQGNITVCISCHFTSLFNRMQF